MTSRLYLQPDLLLTWVPFKIKKTWRHALALEHMCESGGRCFLHYLRMHANPSTRPSLQFSKMLLPLILSLQNFPSLAMQSKAASPAILYVQVLFITPYWHIMALPQSLRIPFTRPCGQSRIFCKLSFSRADIPFLFSLFWLLWHGCEFRWHNEVASN